MIRVLVRAAFVLALVVVGASSWLRLAGNGLGCEPWPRCYAQPQTAAAVQAQAATAALRLVHRIAASAFALTVVALVALLWGRASPAQRGAGVALLLLTALLAVLGRYTPSPWPAVTLVNALGGLGLLALLAWLAGSLQAGDGPAPRPAPALLALLVVALLLQAAGGTLISVRLAATACAQGCSAAWGAGGAALWNPALAGGVADLGLPAAAGVPLHLLHRAGGLLLLIAVVVATGSALLRETAAQTGSAAWAAGATVAVGIGLVVAEPAAWAGAAHMLFAGLALAAVAAALGRLAVRRRYA